MRGLPNSPGASWQDSWAAARPARRLLGEQAPARQIAREMSRSEAPRLAILAISHAVDEAAELGGGDRNDIADLVGEAFPRSIAVLGRRKQSAEKSTAPSGYW
jgi:hypothetical protein